MTAWHVGSASEFGGAAASVLPSAPRADINRVHYYASSAASLAPTSADRRPYRQQTVQARVLGKRDRR
jgi:hypothetical protein